MSETPNAPDNQPEIQYHFRNLLLGISWFDRAVTFGLILLGILFTGTRTLAGDLVVALVSAIIIGLALVLVVVRPLQFRILRQSFKRSHALYLSIIWFYSVLAITLARILLSLPATGKESRPFYVFSILIVLAIYRLILTVYALFPSGYKLFISNIPLWEQILVTINEFVSAGVLSYLLGRQIAHLLQPDIFTLRFEAAYTVGLLSMVIIYYLMMQAMWIHRWNNWLSQNNIWVRLARIISPLALIVATVVIVRHFQHLSEPRSANLLGTANIDQTVLALSPIIWMMVFFIMVIVYSGDRGLRRRILPNALLKQLPQRMRRGFLTVADMDILLIFGALASIVPLQLFITGTTSILTDLQTRISQQNAFIDSSEQALALLFAAPFYVLAALTLALYAYVMIKPNLSARERDEVVERTPITLIIIFIITLYLAAVPFSQVLSTGELPQLPQDTGYILAFDVLIPLLLLIIHYYVFIRVPYGIGQSTWRNSRTSELDQALSAIDERILNLQQSIQQHERVWRNRHALGDTREQQMEMLYELIELNGERDRANMERLRIVSDRQELAEVSETPVSLAVARLPRQVISYGIPLILAFKIYEWAIVEDGLRQVANNPNIGVFEFFQQILENTNF